MGYMSYEGDGGGHQESEIVEVKRGSEKVVSSRDLSLAYLGLWHVVLTASEWIRQSGDETGMDGLEWEGGGSLLTWSMRVTWRWGR